MSDFANQNSMLLEFAFVGQQKIIAVIEFPKADLLGFEIDFGIHDARNHLAALINRIGLSLHGSRGLRLGLYWRRRTTHPSLLLFSLPKAHNFHGTACEGLTSLAQNEDGIFYESVTFRTARKASCGISTFPTRFIRFFPSFCFSSNFRFRVTSPP